MAGTTKAGRSQSHYDSAEHKLRIEYNKLVDDVEVLRAGLAAAGAKVNAVITAAATNIAAVAAVPALVVTTYDAAGDLAAAKVADQNGNTTK